MNDTPLKCFVFRGPGGSDPGGWLRLCRCADNKGAAPGHRLAEGVLRKPKATIEML